MWKKYCIVLTIIIFIMVFTFMYFYLSKFNNSEKISAELSKEVDKIELLLKRVSNLPKGLVYSIILINNSKYTIKQNSVYLSYPIKVPGGYRMNSCKIEAKGNKLDIKPKEKIELYIFVDADNYKNNNALDIAHPIIEIKGYFENVCIKNKFEKSENLKIK